MEPRTKKGQVIHYLTVTTVLLSCFAPARANDLDNKVLLILHSQPVQQQPFIHSTPAALVVHQPAATFLPPMSSMPATPFYLQQPVIRQPVYTFQPMMTQPMRTYSVSCVGRG